MSQDGLSSTPPYSTLKKDDDYFLKGGFVVIQVEDVLFRVPTHRFINNSEFEECPQFESNAKGADSEGSSECNAIRLPGDVRSKDFKSLLKLLYPKTSTDSMITFEKDEWISVLRLATRWYFLDIRKIAMEKLEMIGLSPLENIILGREMKFSKRLIKGYAEVVASPDTISDEDAAVLGWKTTMKLFRLREEHRIKKYLYRGDPSEKIRNALKDELSGILAEELRISTCSLNSILGTAT